MKKKGFSLVEVLMVLAIFTVMFGLIFDIFISGQNAFQSGPEQQDIQNKVRQGINAMTRELFTSKTSKITPLAASPNDNYIIFQVPIGYDASGSLLWGANGMENYRIKFSAESQNLVRSILNTASNVVEQRVLATDVEADGLKFVLPPGSNTLSISLTVKKSVYRRPMAENLTTKVTFRN
jgi:prepilin-type N-terminal cleavage/methylation domain-containing protein